MNEEIPYNPPGMDEYIREGARKNSALLRKMQGESNRTGEARWWNRERSEARMKKCPVCGAGLRAFRRLFLRRVYWYYECEEKPGH